MNRCLYCRGGVAQITFDDQKEAKIPVDTPARTYPPTLVGVFQRRHPMVNTRLQNFFPRLIAFIA